MTVQVTPESTVESLLNVQDDALLKPGEKDSASQILLLVGYVVKKQSDLFSRESFINALNAKFGEYPLLDICSSIQSLRSLTECLENDPRLLRGITPPSPI